LKMILSGGMAGPQELARFRTEAEAIARLNHPNIVQIYEVGEHAGLPFLCLEYVEGSSLSQYLSQGPTLPARDVAGLMETVARAVHHAHQRGVLHRCLAPSNIMLQRVAGAPSSGPAAANEPADSLVPKIIDFGLAKLLDSTQQQTQTGAIMGVPVY